MPNSFLGKVLLQLRRGRLLRSYKGVGGGYRLALPAEKINLLMIFRCINGDELLEACILENHECRWPQHCALHEPWSAIRDQLCALLERATLAELARARNSGPARMAGDAGPEALPRLTNP
jgi:Rrf2 family transcriptional regulator, iron-sulfur cluster assembly transcription factor